MSVPKLVVIADDLTGAADTAARCVQAGLSAEIWLESSLELTREMCTAEVVSLSTDSRFLSPEEANGRVTQTLAALSAWSGVVWYKKIDSTLRGNLGAEVDAMLAMLPETVAVVCPSFPAQGRGLQEGTLIYTGAPPRHLATLLRQQSKLSVSEIGLDVVHQGPDALAAAMDALRNQGERVLVVDGMTDGDLNTIVTAAQGVGKCLLCGSAGLVAPLASRLAARQRPRVESDAMIPPGPILALVGSGSDMAHHQIAQVSKSNAMRVRTLDDGWYGVDLVGAQSYPVGDWLIHLEKPVSATALEGSVARAEAARLADIAYAAVERLQPSVLFVVGGDTAYYALRRLGIQRLIVTEELLPGIALTFGTDKWGTQRAVVLKPGNFGDEQTLVTLQQAIRQRQIVRAH
jgi:uncharacterized protein YgbK (DUF1537 family)